MKRALVEYSTDSEDEKETEAPPVKRKKLLPALSASLTPPVPVDDPSKHQGRIRTRPFVDGEFATHIYIPVSHKQLVKLLEEVINGIREEQNDLEVFSLLEPVTKEDGSVEERKELHLSLSRPLYVQHHQRDAVRKAVKDVVRQTKIFDISFANFTVLDNDEKTRSFLAVEIGAGHSELTSMSSSLTPLLDELRQPAYYNRPRYHVSFAWILTTSPEGPRFPTDLVEKLDEKYGPRLQSFHSNVEEVCTRIGKQITRGRLMA